VSDLKAPSRLQTDCVPRIITSRAFRSTLKSELESAKQTSRFFMPSSSPSDAHRLPKVKWPLRTALRSSFKFRLMDIPAELRIMVAKYALRRPRAFSWIWTNYRKGPRVATLRAGSKYDLAAKLEDVNAIARTCKQLYQETQGLVLYVNIIKFDLYDMHDGSIPKRCQERSPGSNADLRAFSECLEFFRPFVSFGSTSSVRRIELVLSTIDDLLKSKDQFVGLASDVHDLKITLRLDEWSIELLGSYELRKLEELEEEGEPYVPAQQQMEQRVVEYMDQGAQVYAFVEDADVDGRNWRIFPSTMLSREVQGILEYMTEEQQVEVQKWELYGV
jgi:hypothetical protein